MSDSDEKLPEDLTGSFSSDGDADLPPPPPDMDGDPEATGDIPLNPPPATPSAGRGPLAGIRPHDADDTVRESPEDFLGFAPDETTNDPHAADRHPDDEFILPGDQEVTGQFMVPEGISAETRDESAQVFAPKGWPGSAAAAAAEAAAAEAASDDDGIEVGSPTPPTGFEAVKSGDAERDRPTDLPGAAALAAAAAAAEAAAESPEARPYEDAEWTADAPPSEALEYFDGPSDFPAPRRKSNLSPLDMIDDSDFEPDPRIAAQAAADLAAADLPAAVSAAADSPAGPADDEATAADTIPPPPEDVPAPQIASAPQPEPEPEQQPAAASDDWTRQFMVPSAAGKTAPEEAAPEETVPEETAPDTGLADRIEDFPLPPDDEVTFVGFQSGAAPDADPAKEKAAAAAEEIPPPPPADLEDNDVTRAVPREAAGLEPPPAFEPPPPPADLEDNDVTRAVPREAAGLEPPPASEPPPPAGPPADDWHPIDEEEEMSTIMRAAPPPIIEATYGGELPPEEAAPPAGHDDEATARFPMPGSIPDTGSKSPVFETAGRTKALPRSMLTGEEEDDETAEDRIEVAYSLKPDAISSSTEERVVVRAPRAKMPMRRKLLITAIGCVAGLVAGFAGRFFGAGEAVAAWVDSFSPTRIAIRVGIDQDLASSASGVAPESWVRRGDIFIGHDIQESLFHLYDARHGLSLPTAMEVRIRRGPEDVGHLSLLGHSELGGVLLAWPTSRNIEIRRFENPMVRSVVTEMPDSRVLRCLDLSEYFLFHPIPLENWNEPAWLKLLFCGEDPESKHFLQVLGVESRDPGTRFFPGGRLLARPLPWFDTLSDSTRILVASAAQDSIRIQSLEVTESLRRSGTWNLAPGSVIPLPWDSEEDVAVIRCRMGESPGWLVAQENRYAFISQKPGGELELARNHSGEINARYSGETAPVVLAFPGSVDPAFDDAVILLPAESASGRSTGVWLEHNGQARNGTWLPRRPFRVPGVAGEPLAADFNVDGAWDVLGFSAEGAPWVLDGRTGQPSDGVLTVATEGAVPPFSGEVAWFVPRTDPRADGFFISADGKPVRLIIDLNPETHGWLERDRAWREERIPFFSGYEGLAAASSDVAAAEGDAP